MEVFAEVMGDDRKHIWRHNVQALQFWACSSKEGQDKLHNSGNLVKLAGAGAKDGRTGLRAGNNQRFQLDACDILDVKCHLVQKAFQGLDDVLFALCSRQLHSIRT